MLQLAYDLDEPEEGGIALNIIPLILSEVERQGSRFVFPIDIKKMLIWIYLYYYDYENSLLSWYIRRVQPQRVLQTCLFIYSMTTHSNVFQLIFTFYKQDEAYTTSFTIQISSDM